MKTRFALSALLLQLFAISFGFSQSEIARNSKAIVSSHNTSNPISATMMAPSFVGGNDALTAYMRTNLQYPKTAKKIGIEGTVIVECYIKENGMIENVKVAKSAHALLDEEAIRLVKNMPLWNPATQNGNPTRVKYQLPVTFNLLF